MEATAEIQDQPNFREMLLRLKEDINDETILQLAAVPVAEYRNVLKAARGKELRNILAATLQFDWIVNATPAMRKISQNTKDALKLIGADSPMNARRVGKYGIKVGAQEPPNLAAEAGNDGIAPLTEPVAASLATPAGPSPK